MALGVAGAHEKPIRPGLKSGRVAELGKVSPNVQQRLLRRVLGEADVAQNPVRHGKEPITEARSEAGESLTVSALCSFHQIGIHAYTVWAEPISNPSFR
jgi:hypothetical protein